MNLDEAEIQVLATLHTSSQEDTATDRISLEQGGERYWIYLEDWANSFSSLASKGLIDGDENGYRLTTKGGEIARQCYTDKPDRYSYYYRDFYRNAHKSAAHSRLCEQVFGKDLTQEGQMDMDSLHNLMSILDLKPGMHLLDLGCGAGGIAEYISDQTGARVTGLEYSPVAVQVAKERTIEKRDKIDFIQGDLNDLDLPERSFDAAVMIDSIYWVNDTVSAIRRILDCIKPGGQLLIVIVHMLSYCQDESELAIDTNFLARTLDSLGSVYSSLDTTEEFLPFWPRIRKSLDGLHQEFVAEGNDTIYQSLLDEAETEYLSAIRNGDLRRYLYIVDV